MLLFLPHKSTRILTNFYRYYHILFSEHYYNFWRITFSLVFFSFVSESFSIATAIAIQTSFCHSTFSLHEQESEAPYLLDRSNKRFVFDVMCDREKLPFIQYLSHLFSLNVALEFNRHVPPFL